VFPYFKHVPVYKPNNSLSTTRMVICLTKMYERTCLAQISMETSSATGGTLPSDEVTWEVIETVST